MSRTNKIEYETEEEFEVSLSQSDDEIAYDEVVYEDDEEYERLKREGEEREARKREEEARERERKARMAEIERKRRYKGDIETLRERRVDVYERDNERLENLRNEYDDEINKLHKKIERFNSLKQETYECEERNDIKINSIRNGDEDDDIIEAEMKREPAKKAVKKPVKKAVKKDDDDDSDCESVCSTKSKTARKKRVNRGKHNDWVRYFGSNTKMRMKYSGRNHYGLIVIDKRRGEYNTANCKVMNTTSRGEISSIKYRKYRLKPAEDMPVGFYGDEFNDNEFKTPNDWLEAVGCCHNFIKCKKSVWRTCEFLNEETNEWISLNNYALGEIVIN